MKEQKRNKNFDNLMIEALQKSASFFAWKSIDGIIEKCELKVKAYRIDYNEIEFEIKPGQDAQFKKLITGSRTLNLYTPEISMSFSAELRGVLENKKVKISRPAEYSFHERRRHERIHPLNTCYLSFEYNKFLMKKSIHDISISGASIILAKSEKIVIYKNKLFPLLILDLGVRKIRVSAECVNMTNIDRFDSEKFPYGGQKISFRFLNISKEDRDFLAGHFVQEKLMLRGKKVNE